jgi:hypothetical protein
MLLGKWIKTTIIHQPSKSVTRVLPLVKVCPLFSSLMISKWNKTKIPGRLRRNEMPPLFSFFYIYGKHEYHRVRESNGFRRHVWFPLHCWPAVDRIQWFSEHLSSSTIPSGSHQPYGPAAYLWLRSDEITMHNLIFFFPRGMYNCNCFIYSSQKYAIN